MELLENKKPRFKNRGFFATPEEQAVQPRPSYFQFLYPHFVSEARNFRHCDRVNNVTCQVLYPLGNDNTNVVNIYEISNNKFAIDFYSTDYQRVYPRSLVSLFLKQKAKLNAWLHAERGHPDPNILTLITRFSVRNLCRFLTKGKEQSKDTKKSFLFNTTLRHI